MSDHYVFNWPILVTSKKKLTMLSKYLLGGLAGGLLLAAFLMGFRGSMQKPDRDDVFERSQPQIKSATFWGPNRAWLVGSKAGNLWRTEDGGRHWHNIPGSAVGGKFYATSFIDERKGWGVGTGGSIWRSEDGGNTWARISNLEISNPNEWSFMSSQQMQFVDDSNGWLVETLSIWRTGDGGHNWKRVLGIGEPGITAQPGNAAFLSANLAVVSSFGGKVYRTEDGGKSWKSQTVKDDDLRDVSFGDSQTGWLTGYGPPDYKTSVYQSVDGGVSWQVLPISDQELSIYSIDFLTKENGWASGAIRKGYHRSSEGVVLHTTDGAKSWQEVPVSQVEPSFEKVHFTDALHGWLFSRHNVYRTEDGGRTWRTVLSIPPIRTNPGNLRRVN